MEKTDPAVLRDKLGARSLVLIGMMGAGKTTIGRRLARKLGLGFIDADAEIEAAAGMKVSDIFESLGEQAFRDGERKVIERLLKAGPQVLATGGGAFIDERTRALIKENAVSVWLKAELSVLFERVKRKQSRPLLLNTDPEGTMRRLLEERAKIYARADITVHSDDNTHDKVVAAVLAALTRHLGAAK